MTCGSIPSYATGVVGRDGSFSFFLNVRFVMKTTTINEKRNDSFLMEILFKNNRF